MEKPLSIIPAAGAHGGDGATIARAFGLAPETILDLSQSLNPIAADPIPVVTAHLDAIGRYPDPLAAHRALASAMSVDPDRLLLTNGGAEAIALVAGLLGGSVKEPEFSLHPRGTGPFWRSNPHSPTGLLANPSERAAVWDEAFYPLSTGRWTRGDEGTTVVGSLTKLLSCPGLRIGYVLGEVDVIDSCRRLQPMWSLNGLAAAALPELLAPIDLPAINATIKKLRAELVVILKRHGLFVLPSEANWVLVRQAGLREALAHELIAVRDCASFGLPGLARIAVPDSVGLARLDEALGRLDGRLKPSSEHLAPLDVVSTDQKKGGQK